MSAVHYVLGPDARTPRPASLEEWAANFEGRRKDEGAPRPGAGWARVAFDRFGRVAVSTVFLGLDHRFGQGLPLVFETMVFGGELSDWQERYSTWDEAVAGHAELVARVRESQRWWRRLGHWLRFGSGRP